MRTLRRAPLRAAEELRGAALLMAFLVLIVLLAIVYQVHTVTQTDARVSRNEITRSTMDLALQSVMLQVYEDLAEDARAAQGGEEGAADGLGGDPASPAAPPVGEGEAGELARNPETVDSMMDSWFAPQSTNFGDIQVRIFVRDENSKYNVLNMINPDEEVVEEAYDRVVRILDNFREETEFDLTSTEAEEVATAMQEYMQDRRTMDRIPRATFLNGDEELDDQVLPMTFREFRLLEPFRDDMFMDFFGEDDERIHGIEAFLTIYTAPAVGPEEANSGRPSGTGGWTVNMNTAPLAVLAALIDDREIDFRLWDEIKEYRNEEEEPLEEEGSEDGLGPEEADPMLDEFGEEILPTKIFDSLDELEELFEFQDLDEEEKTTVRELLRVDSDVFEIVLAARISTRAETADEMDFESRTEREKFFRSGEHLVRVVRSVVWRREVEDDIEIVPLVPWEVLDNAPLQVLDKPEDE